LSTLIIISDIDEASPSEDEQAAQLALHGDAGNPSSYEDNHYNAPSDVLNDHQARNRPNKPPSQQQLLEAAKRQLQSTPNNEMSGEDSDGEDSQMDGSRGSRKSNVNVSPITAGYYPHCWREAIDRAKERFRRFIVLHDLFPARDTHLQDAAMILSKVIADEKASGKIFDPGRGLIPIIYDSNSFTLVTEFEQNRDMNIVVSKVF
jgi:hypothetical protein